MQELVDEWQKSVRMLAIECYILIILRDRDMSGLEIKHEFKDRIKNVNTLIGVDPCLSLYSMERRGLISTGRKDSKSELGTGKCYHITEKGKFWLKEIVSDCNTHRGQEKRMQ